MQWRRFLLWNGLGGIVWTAAYGFGAYLLGTQMKHLLGPVGLVLGAIAVGVVIWSWRVHPAERGAADPRGEAAKELS